MLENCSKAVAFIERQNIKLVAIGGSDICDGNLKLILGLIWTLILRYQIQRGRKGQAGSPKNALLEWVASKVKPRGVQVNNFNTDWQDGKILYHLTDVLKPGALAPIASLGEPINVVTTAMKAAQAELGVPMIMIPEDMVKAPEDLSIMTYVSYFQQAEEKQKEAKVAADPTKCQVSGEGIVSAKLGAVAFFTITANDSTGKRRVTGGEAFTVLIKNANGANIPANVKDNNNGTYSVTYTPSDVAELTITVSLGSAQVTKKQVPVIPVAYEFNFRGNGISGGAIGKPANFVIEILNENVQKATVQSADFQIHVKGPGGANISGELKQQDSGTLEYTYTPSAPGSYTIEVLMSGKPITKPFKPSFTSPTDASHCVAHGKGLERPSAGEMAVFEIVAKGSDGAPKTSGGDTFNVVFHGPKPIKPYVQDNLDGTYTVTYRPEEIAEYKIDVLLGGNQPIHGSPFSVKVRPSLNHAKLSLSGNGIHGGTVGSTCSFFLSVKDKNDKPISVDLSDIVSSITGGPQPIQAKVSEKEPGNYHIEYVPKAEGSYKLDLLLGGQSVFGGPRDISIKPGGSASFCEFQNVGLPVLGKQSGFKIIAKGPNGQKSTTGGEAFEVTVKGSSGTSIPVKIHDNMNGEYIVEYTPTKLEKLSIDATLHGEHIKDSPLTSYVIPSASLKCGLSGNGLNAPVPGQEAVFSIDVSDQATNKPAEIYPEAFVFKINGPKGPIPVKITPKNPHDGHAHQFDVSYNPKDAGAYTIDILLFGRSIVGNPISANAVSAAAASPEKTHVDFSALKNAKADSPVSFTIHASDEHGKKKTTGGDAFSAIVNGPDGENVDVQVKDNGNGTYTISFHPKKPGKYTIQILLAGKPFLQQVVSLAPAKALKANLSITAPPSVNTQSSVKFDVTDDSNHPYDILEGDIDVKITGAGDPATHLEKHGVGSYSIRFTPTKPGDILLTASLFGAPISSGPIKIGTVASAADPAHTTIENFKTEASNGHPFIFSIQGKRSDGSKSVEGGAHFQVSIKDDHGASVDSSDIHVKDNGDGTYSVSWDAKKPGHYNIDISIDGVLLKGCPFRVFIKEASAPKLSSIKVIPWIDSKVTVTAFSRDGHQRKQGGEPVVIEVHDQAGKVYESKVADHNDGTYTVEFKSPPGVYTITGKIDGEHVKGSPLTYKLKLDVDITESS
eukprot:TRINITY_DN3052_c0_g3_i3.p1 TRINITY_DN3052_c0_g3~~TRINITY_DN3052_c0_g3_i3.p1  ORF type:complete len:1266 (+),score=382.28 TRINITY_DN3052_c0_g3_i3:257-3799(+)